MKRTFILLLALMLLLSSASMVFGNGTVNSDTATAPQIKAATQAEDWLDSGTNEYSFPITPESPEWKEFVTHDEMIEACTIPEDVLKSISTVDLVKLVLEYSLLGEFRAFSTEAQGLEVLKTNFNGLRELLDRDDGLTTLIDAYKSVPIEKDRMVPTMLKNAALDSNSSGEKLTAALDQYEAQNPKGYKNFSDGIVNVTQIEFIELLLSQESARLSAKEINNFQAYKGSKQPQKDESSLYSSDSVQPRATIVLKTPSGIIVPSSAYIVDGPEYTATKIASVTQDYRNMFPNATVLRNASNVYNCHSYAGTTSHYQIGCG